MIHVHLDMDSVLFDLPTALNIWTGHSDIESDKTAFWKALPAFAMQSGFMNLPKMPMADRLVRHLLNIPKHQVRLSILTSAGDFYDVPEVMVQKKRSLTKNFPELAKIPFCATTSGVDKALYAHSKSFLIDDYDRNIRVFKEAGGHGFVWLPTENNFVNLKHELYNLYKDFK